MPLESPVSALVLNGAVTREAVAGAVHEVIPDNATGPHCGMLDQASDGLNSPGGTEVWGNPVKVGAAEGRVARLPSDDLQRPSAREVKDRRNAIKRREAPEDCRVEVLHREPRGRSYERRRNVDPSGRRSSGAMGAARWDGREYRLTRTARGLVSLTRDTRLE